MSGEKIVLIIDPTPQMKCQGEGEKLPPLYSRRIRLPSPFDFCPSFPRSPRINPTIHNQRNERPRCDLPAGLQRPVLKQIPRCLLLRSGRGTKREFCPEASLYSAHASPVPRPGRPTRWLSGRSKSTSSPWNKTTQSAAHPLSHLTAVKPPFSHFTSLRCIEIKSSEISSSHHSVAESHYTFTPRQV